MNLPKNGRIVVVDNDPEDALPLIKTLSKLGHPVHFLSGNSKELPAAPFSEIRILFLDMVLIANSSHMDTKAITSMFKSVLDRILSPTNGPFLLIAWTDNQDYVAELREYLAGRNFHYPVIELVKSSCKSDGEFDLDLIKKQLARAIDRNESLDFFVCWENIVNDSASKTANQILELETFDNGWNEKMKSIILKLAASYVGKELEQCNPYEVMTCALFSLNGAFTDTLYTSIQNDSNLKNIQLHFKSIPKNTRPQVNGIINSKISLDQSSKQIGHGMPMPGYVYVHHYATEVPIGELLKLNDSQSHKDPVRKKDDELKNVKQVVLEVTPACDYAQQKAKVSRLLPGFLCPTSIFSCKNGDYLYRSPTIKLNDDDELYMLIFDLRLFTSGPFDAIDQSKYLFRLRPELLADIQSRLSGHVSRLGVISLE